MMKRALIGFVAVAALSGCYVTPQPYGPGPGPGPYAGPGPGPGPYAGAAYDVYYDGGYGPAFYDGYWGPGGVFIYRTRVGGPWIRDDAHHFVREARPGFRGVRLPGHGPDRGPGPGDRDHDHR